MTDLPSDDHILASARLIRAHQTVLRAVEADLKVAGFLPLGWYDVELELGRAPAIALRSLEIETRLLLAQHNVSRLIDRMERAGLVRRATCDSDGRGQVVQATPEGVALQRSMWPAYGAAIARHFADRLDTNYARRLASAAGPVRDAGVTP